MRAVDRLAISGVFLSAGVLALMPAPGRTQPATLPVATAIKTSNLNINPKRVTFDRLGKSAAVYVFNQGAGGAAFDVTLVDRLMLPSGQIIPLSDATGKPELAAIVARLKSARDMLLATPRRVTLTGNSGQTIRVRASSPGEVAPGEYRTHLTVTALPPPDVGLTAEQAASTKQGQLSFHVDTVLGLSIPVIIRVGPIDVRAGIENARLGGEDIPAVPGGKPVRTPVLSLDLVRVGANSLFGDIEVRGTRERGDREPLGTVRGIGVYPEIDRRVVKIALRRVPAAGEPLELVFRDDDVTPGKQLSRVMITAP